MKKKFAPAKITESTDTFRTYIEKYILGNHGYKHIHHVITPGKVVMVFDGPIEIERIMPKREVAVNA